MKGAVKHWHPRPTGPRVERIGHNEFQVLGIEALSPTFFTREDGENWLRKVLEKVPKAKRPQVRACLCCGSGFESDGFHNRMCNRCRLNASQATDAPFSFGAIHGRKRSA